MTYKVFLFSTMPRRRRNAHTSRKKRRVANKRTHSNKKFHKALCVLKSMKHSERCRSLASANNTFIRKFSNTVKKLRNRQISAKQKKRLKPYTHHLRRIANPKVSISSKRKILSQRGGGLLSALLPLAVSVVGPLVNRIFRRA